MQEKDLNTPPTTNGTRGISLWGCLGLGAAILGTGILLFWMGDGFPPLAWRQFAQLLSEHTPSRSQFPLVLGQMAFLVAAWGLLLILIIRSMFHLWHDGLAGGTTPRPHARHLREQTHRSAVLESHAPLLQPAQPDTTSESPPQSVNRVGGLSSTHEDHDRDVSPSLQGADAPLSSPFQPLQPALFGEPLKLTVGSCSDEGIQHEPSTTAYLLTEVGSENGTSPSLPMSLFALVDRLPREEPAYTRSCLAVASMRDTVIHAYTGAQLSGDEELATLLDEQVQRVTHVIAQHSQDEETVLAMAAALIVGSHLFVANTGETCVSLCRSQEDLSQLTEAPAVMPLLAARSSPAARHSPRQNKKHQPLRQSATSRTITGYSSAVPLVEGDIILLCSDGVWSILHAAYLEHLIRSAGPDPTAICSAVRLAVRKSGSTDPVNMIAVSCHHHHVEDRS